MSSQPKDATSQALSTPSRRARPGDAGSCHLPGAERQRAACCALMNRPYTRAALPGADPLRPQESCPGPRAHHRHHRRLPRRDRRRTATDTAQPDPRGPVRRALHVHLQLRARARPPAEMPDPISHAARGRAGGSDALLQRPGRRSARSEARTPTSAGP